MKLNVNERLIIVGIVPEKGNFKTMTTVEKLKSILHLSEEEIKKYEVIQKGESLLWNKLGVEKTEVEISELGHELIMDGFEKLDKKEELTLQQFTVYKYLKEEQKKLEELEKPKDKN